MSYDNNIPVSGQTLGGTRVQINQNFADIASINAINHVAFNDADEGKHKFMQMPVQGSAPATATSEAALYAADDSGGAAQLFYRSETNGKTYQLTYALDAQFDTYFGKNAAYTNTGIDYVGGFSFLPGGLIMIYGNTVNATSAGTINIKFPFAFPTSILQAWFTPVKSGSVSTQSLSIDPTSLTTTGFNIIHGDTHSWTMNFWAIGK